MAKIAPRDIASFLQSPFSRNYTAVLFYGPNKGQISDFAKKCCALAVPDVNDPFNVIQINGETFDPSTISISDEMNAFSLMGDRKLVHVRYATEKLAKPIEEALNDYTGTNILVVEADELSPSSSLRKMAEKLPNIACIACYEETTSDVVRLVTQHMQQNGFSIDRAASDYLTNTLSGNRQSAMAEIEKLMLYVGYPNKGEPPKTITYDDVTACIGDRTENDMFELCNVVASGNFAQMDKIFYQLQNESVSEVAMLRTTQNYFARLQQVQSAISSGDTREAAIKKLYPPLFFKARPIFEKHLSQWSLAALDSAQKRLVKTEAGIKKTGAPASSLTHRTFMALAHQAARSIRK